MSDVVNLMLVQANTFHQVHLDFITGRNTTQQIVTVLSTLLSNGQQGRDVVTGVRVIGGQERVMKVKFTNGCPISPRGPLSTNAMAGRKPKQSRSIGTRMSIGHGSGGLNRSTVERRDAYRGVVDDLSLIHI